MTYAQIECPHGTTLRERADEDKHDDLTLEEIQLMFGSHVTEEDLADVQQMEIRNCRVRFNATHDATLIANPSLVLANISTEGVISAQGAATFLFQELHDLTEQPSREEFLRHMEEKVTEFVSTGDYEETFRNNQTVTRDYDRSKKLVFLAQDHIIVPVLSFRGQVCIDYTHGRRIYGMQMLDTAGAIIRTPTVYTSQLYSVPLMTDLVVCGYYENPTTGEISFSAFIRYVEGDTRHDNNATLLAMFDSCAKLCTALGTDDFFGAKPAQDAIFGEPVPVRISHGSFHVAPIGIHGSGDALTFTNHPSYLNAVTLASALAKGTNQNVIGTAMQKIAIGEQGDIMLHDGK